MKSQLQRNLGITGVCILLISGCGNPAADENQTEAVEQSIASESAISANLPEFGAVISDDRGKPLEGVMVSLVSADEMRLTTRFTNKSGSVDFPTLADDEKSIRVRLTGYADQILEIKSGVKKLRAALRPASQEELLEQLPSHVWAERIHAPNERVQREFRVQCMMCHQMGYPNTRIHDTPESWFPVFERMANKGTRALLTEETRNSMADALVAAFDYDGALGMPRAPDAATGAATEVEITEWRLEDSQASMHDVAVGPDRKIYGVDTVGSNIWRLDPETNKIEELTRLRPDNRPAQTPLLLHTVLQGPDEKMWFTYAFGNLVASLDVFTEEMKVYEMSYEDGVYPHTLRFDTDGQLWFTVSYTNQLGTIDPETDKIVLYDMPTRNELQKEAADPHLAIQEVTRHRTGDEVIAPQDEINTIAYGIAATPDGKIWFSQFNNRRIGSFDKKTKTFNMVDTPFGGPRRFRSDSNGDLWIPSYAEGGLYRYEPDADKFTRFDLPTGPGDAVYALAVDPADDTIWACGSNSDTMMHLMPETGEVVTYQLPSHVTFCREINFAEDGSVWTSYSQYPSGSIEGGSSVFARIRRLKN